jgi:hypothetical protein
MAGRYRTADGSGFSHESIERALDTHLAAGLIKSWKRDPRTHGASGTREVPLYTVTVTDGFTLNLASIWEALALVYGLTSARVAYLRTGARTPAQAEEAGEAVDVRHSGGRAAAG